MKTTTHPMAQSLRDIAHGMNATANQATLRDAAELIDRLRATVAEVTPLVCDATTHIHADGAKETACSSAQMKRARTEDIDFDAIAWAYAKLGDFNVLSSTAENARMADRLYSMLRHRA